MRVLVPLLAAMLLVACPGNGGDPDGGTPDGSVGDGGGAPTGDPCPGGLPSACEHRICLSGEAGQTYCSEYCEAGSCPAGFPCQRYVFGDANGDSADLRDVCAPPCSQDGNCQSGRCDTVSGTCEAPPDGTRQMGESCGSTDGVCVHGLICSDVMGAGQCLPTCSPSADPFCADGAFCWASNIPDGGRCWPGGPLGLDDPCESHLECGHGLLCIAQGGAAACMAGCDPSDGDPACAAGVCIPLEGRSYGFCQT